MKELNCDDVEARLQDFADGVLDAAEERRLREHLASCARCRSEEREARRLLSRVAELPRSIAPPRDLWPEVAARLGEQSPAPPVEVAAGRRRRGPWRRWSARQWALQAAAALAFTVLGGVLGQRIAPAPSAYPWPPDAAAPAAASPGFQTLETEYLRAKTAWWLVVYSRHEELSPETVEAVQRNLVILDRAIWELREALEVDPGNRQLESLLLAQHRRGIDLLRRLADRSA